MALYNLFLMFLFYGKYTYEIFPPHKILSVQYSIVSYMDNAVQSSTTYSSCINETIIISLLYKKFFKKFLWLYMRLGLGSNPSERFHSRDNT